MALRNYSSTAGATTLSATVTAGSTALLVDSTVGFPSVPFHLTLDPDTVSEETVLVTAVSGTTLTVTRGQDNTPAATHETGAVVEHRFTATDATEANAHINAETGIHGLAPGESVASEAFATAAAIAAAHIVGEIRMYGAAGAPSGWLACNGAAVSRTTYSALYAVIGTSFGVGDGSTTFNLPDFSGKVPMGGGTLGATGGKDSHDVTLLEANLPSHTHSINHSHGSTSTDGDHEHDHKYSTSDGTAPGVMRTGAIGDASEHTGANGVLEADSAHSHAIPAFSGNSGSTGSGTAFTVPTVPSHQRVTFIIYAGV